MTATSRAELVALLLADGRLPVGGHTQSSGLEPALLAGMPADLVPELIATRLRTVVLVDASTAVVARHDVLTGRPLDGVHAAWAARTPSDVTRAASVAVGRGHRRLLRRLWPGSAAAVAVDSLPAPARPVALGAVTAAAGLDARQTARLVAYDDVQSLCAAALKLCPLDPLDAARWLLDTGDEVAALVETVAGLTTPEEIPAPSAPLMELWQHAHAHRPRRLFSA